MAETFDKEAIYDEQIAPLMSQIIAVCKEHGIPVVAQFQYAEDGYCTTRITNQPYASEYIQELSAFVERRLGPPVVLAETITTRPDGGQDISIRRIE